MKTLALVLAVVALLVPAAPSGAARETHNLGIFTGKLFRLARDGQRAYACAVVLRLASDHRGTLTFTTCADPRTGYLGCIFPLAFVKRIGLGNWQWRVSGSGRSDATRTCLDPNGIPRQTFSTRIGGQGGSATGDPLWIVFRAAHQPNRRDTLTGTLTRTRTAG